MQELLLKNITKNYDGLDGAVSDINLSIASGAVFLVQGSIGSGKSTLCRIIAGLENPSSGEMFFNGVEYGSVTIKQRDICYIGDSCTLWNGKLNKTIIKGAKNHGIEKSVIEDRLKIASELLGLEKWLKHNYKKKSEKLPQDIILKAQLARAIVREPKILIIDDMFLGCDIEFLENFVIDDFLNPLINTVKNLKNTITIITTSEIVEAEFLASSLAIEYNVMASGILFL